MSFNVDMVTFCPVEFVANAYGKYGDTENGKIKMELASKTITQILRIL